MTLLDRYTPAQLKVILDDPDIDPARKAWIITEISHAKDQEAMEVYSRDTALWVKEKLGEHLWSIQKEIAQSVIENRRTAVPSCHNAGKTYTASRIAAHFLSTHKPGEAFVVSSAPTFPQVRMLLWKEIGRAHRKGDLIGRVNQTEWLIDNEPIGFGRKPANKAEGGIDQTVTEFQGVHALYVLVILDEATGIPKELWEAADSLISNENSRILAIGNPDDPTSYFAKVCQPDSGWNVIPISAFDTPNLTGEEVPDVIRDSVVSKIWVEEKRKLWLAGGIPEEESPLWMAKVLGRFPRDKTDSLIPYSLASKARLITNEPKGEISLGMDIGGGIDETTIWAEQNLRFWKVASSYSTDPMQLAGDAMVVIRQLKPKRINIDAIGLGWGVAGRVKEICAEEELDVDVNSVWVSESPTEENEDADEPNKKKYVNLKAQLWWSMREIVQQGLADFSNLEDEQVRELTEFKWSRNSRGAIVVEEKILVKKRLGRSPDNADAIILSAFVPPPEQTGGYFFF